MLLIGLGKILNERHYNFANMINMFDEYVLDN
jgi:hypothetical protein